jgi:choline dehydrogenase
VCEARSHECQITLWNADPTEPPIVDMGLHAAAADLTRLAMGIELLRKVMAHPILRQYEAAEVLPGPSYGTREQLEDYLRRYSAFGHHASGTAKMGRPTDPMAVVDSECRVIGVDGLRVCDASIFPEIPSYNTSRPSYLVGEVLGELLTKRSGRDAVAIDAEPAPALIG